MIALSRWRFTTLEFVVLWETMRRDRLPFPFTWRADVATADELERQKATARTDIDDALSQAVQLLTNPVLRVQTCGFVNGEPGALLHAAIGSAHAVVARQEGRHITVELVPATDLASHITLPPARPGSERGGTVSSSRSMMTDSGDDRQRLTRLLNRTRSGGGELLVGTSSRADCCIDDVSGGFSWIEVVGDGRYLLSGTDPATVTPATDAATAALIGRYLVGTV